MIVLFYFLAALLIYLSYKSLRSGIEYLNYFKDELARTKSNYAPSATIIAPCKGLDEGLADNLRALLVQKYPEYEVIFVVDDEHDPAVGVIDRIIAGEASISHSVPASGLAGNRLVVAAKASDSGQKVENLREAVLHAKGDVLVFVDSDVRPAKDWLSHLVAPLEDETVGAATGYRWFISNAPTLASEMRSAWNASIASALGPNQKSNFAWGGSTAIRRETFERIEMRKKWKGTLSDDFALTNAIKKVGLSIHFVPQALTASVGNCSLRALFDFTTRQMQVTRVYAPNYWRLSMFGSGLFTAVILAAFAIALFSKQNDLAVSAAVATLVLVSLFSIGKAWLRMKAVMLVLDVYRTGLRRQMIAQCTLWLLAPPLFFYNCLAALLSRRMTWRGVRYELVSATETRILRQ